MGIQQYLTSDMCEDDLVTMVQLVEFLSYSDQQHQLQMNLQRRNMVWLCDLYQKQLQAIATAMGMTGKLTVDFGTRVMQEHAAKLRSDLKSEQKRLERAEAALEPFGRLATAISKQRRYEADAEVRPDRIEWRFNDDVTITLGDLERIIVYFFERDYALMTRGEQDHDSNP